MSNILQEFIEDILQNNDLLSGQYGFGNASGGGGSSSSSTYPWDCDGDVITTYVIEPVMCSESIHWPWSSGTCSATIKAYYNTVTTYECIPSVFDDVVYPPSGGNNNNIGGGGASSGATGNPSNFNSITTIIDKPEIDCKNLAEMLDPNKTNLIHYINLLAAKHEANESNEFAYVFRKQIQYSDPFTEEVTYTYLEPYIFEGTPLSVITNPDTKSYSDMHLHTTAEGSASGIFSWGDIFNFNSFYMEIPNAQPMAIFKEKNDLSTMLLAPDPQDPYNPNKYNVYAITINDPVQLMNSVQNEWSKWSNYIDAKKRMEKINRAFGTDYVKNKDNLERFFIDKFVNYGITLYKFENNQWNELRPDEVDKSKVKKQPCK